MAQIIKHRRGSIDSVKNSTSRKGELIMATGSIGNLNGPFVFIGTDEGSGLYSPASKLYAGSSAPTLDASTYGTTLDGTPFYGSSEKSLYILNNSNVGNSKMDLTGNIEGNTISGVTINALTSSFVSGAFIGDATGLYNIPASGVTGLNLSKIYSGSVEVNTDSVTGQITLSGGTVNIKNDVYVDSSTLYIGDNNSQIYQDGRFYIQDNTNGVQVQSTNFVDLQSNDNYVYLEGGYNEIYSSGNTDIYGNGTIQMYAQSGNLDMWANDGTVYLTNNTNNSSIDINGRNGSTTNINTQQGQNVGDVYILSNQGNQLYVQGNTHLQSTVYFDNALSMYHDGTFYIEDTDNTGIEIQSTNYTKLRQQDNSAYFYTSQNYAEMYGNTGLDVYTNSGNLWVYNNAGNVNISSYDGNNLNLNADGGEGNVYVLNGSNSININGASNFTGSVNISGNTSMTGSLVVSDGAAFINQGVISQNSNVTLTSGSNLYIQNGGSAYVDYIYGNTNSGHYLSFNGGPAGAPDVELESSGNISLWAEGGTVSVTGSLVVSGDITMKGNINLGDMSGDTINFNGEISSSLIPSGSLVFDLGSTTNQWNNLYVGTLHANNVSLDSISFSGLTEGRAVFVGAQGSLKDDAAFTFDSGSSTLTAYRMNANDDSGNAYNFLVGNDVYIGDINQANTMMFKGAGDDTQMQIRLGNYSSNNYLDANYGNISLNSDNNLNLRSSNSHVYMESYDGTIYLNDDSGNNIYLGGNTSLNTNRTMYVSRMRDNHGNSNLLELYGWGTDDGYWWESGNGSDTTLYNWENSSNLNLLQMNNGKVNIAARQGSVNLYSQDGFNVTGSMVVSDGSGVFNSSLVVNNSDLTLDGGSNQHMNDGAHLYFDTCIDIYFDNGPGNLIFYNDCNGFEFQQNTQFNGSITVNNSVYLHSDLYVTGHTYSDNYHGLNNNSNVLRMNGGSFGAPDVELVSNGQLSLFAEGNSNPSRITMTGSVYSNDNVQINNGNYLYTNNIYDVNSGDLNIAADGGLYLWSDSARYVEIASDNSESGTNYVVVDNNGVKLQTYDYTSDLNHSVVLDNTGSLKLTNVDFIVSGSLNVDGNSTFNNNLTVGGDMYVSGNFTVLGTGSTIHLTASQVDIGTNIINLNTYAPFERFAGISVYDSGSNVGVTGSLLWDSQNNVWIYANPSGSAYASARFISGPKNTGSLGQETGLTVGHIPVAVGDDHISDSLLTYIGTTLALNSNKFTVDSDSGDVEIQGNFTIHGMGGTDNGEATSYVVFRNSDDVLGFVDTADSGNELAQMLGYNNATGNLEFSSLIDGGTY